MNEKDTKKTDAKPDDGSIVTDRRHIQVNAPRTERPEATRGKPEVEGDDRPKLTKAAAKIAVETGGRAAIPNDPMASAADRQPQPVGATEQGSVNADGEPDTPEKQAERLAFHGVKGKAR